MPRRTRPGEWAIIYAEVPPPLKRKLEAMAVRNLRSVTGEITLALNKHTADEPDPAGGPEPEKAPAKKPKKSPRKGEQG
jgi:hypothetical protein